MCANGVENEVGPGGWDELVESRQQALLAEAAAVASCSRGEGSASRAFSGLAKKRRNERLEVCRLQIAGRLAAGL